MEERITVWFAEIRKMPEAMDQSEQWTPLGVFTDPGLAYNAGRALLNDSDSPKLEFRVRAFNLNQPINGG